MSDAIPRTRERLAAGVASGREPGVQLAVSLSGQIVATAALGESRAGVPMRDDTLVLWISCTKPVMGVAFAQLLDRGLVALDDPVAKYLPAFARGGKETVSLRHVLTHTGGFRHAWRTWHPAPPRQQVVERICASDQEPGWEPGCSSGYNVAAGWYVLAAVLETVDGRSYRDYTRAEIFEPLGMHDCWVSMAPEIHATYGSRIGAMPSLEDGEWRQSEAWGGAVGCAVERPGGNGYGPMCQHLRLYEMLLGRGERAGVRLLSPERAALVHARHTQGLPDATFGGVVYDRGLGVVVNSRERDPRFVWFGRRASADAFGHQGFFSSVSLADPAHDLALGLCFHGVRAFDPAHDARVVEALDGLYEELGLA